GALKINLVGKGILDFSEPLTNDQLAPLGFLIVQRTIVKVLGDSNFALRLLPLASGLAALFLFARLTRRILPRRPALVALVLFAFSDDQIYYASEMKPYSLDLVLGLAITLAALDALEKPVSRDRFALVALLAVVAPWCSFSSAFIVV